MNKRTFLILLMIFLMSGMAIAYNVDFAAPSVNNLSDVVSPELGSLVFNSASGVFFGNTGMGGNAIWTPLTPTVPRYASGTFDQNYRWQLTTTGAYYSFTNIASGTFSVVNSSVMVVTEPAGHGLGISFTPDSSVAAYQITLQVPCVGTSHSSPEVRLYDTVNNIQIDEFQLEDFNEAAVVLTGIYVPGSTLPTTVLVQGWVYNSTECGGAVFGPAKTTWSIQQIR